MRFLSSASGVAVAGVLLFTAVIHATQPYYFIHSIASYRLLPPEIAGFVGLWLPYLQIVLALAIAVQIGERAALYLAGSLFLTFGLAQIAVLLRGIEIDCGCFGFVAHRVSPASAALPLVLVVACLVAIAGASSRRGAPDGEGTEKNDALLCSTPPSRP